MRSGCRQGRPSWLAGARDGQHGCHGRSPPFSSSARSGLDGMFSTLRGFGVRRNTDDRWLAGVCSGIADRLGIDPLIVRGALIVLLFVGGLGGLVYLIAWALLPDQNGKILAEAALHGDGWGIALLIVIGIALISNISDRWWLWTILVPVGLLCGGRSTPLGRERRPSRWVRRRASSATSSPPPSRARPSRPRTTPSPPPRRKPRRCPPRPLPPPLSARGPTVRNGPRPHRRRRRPRARRAPPPAARRIPRPAAHRRPRRRGVRARPVVCGGNRLRGISGGARGRVRGRRSGPRPDRRRPDRPPSRFHRVPRGPGRAGHRRRHLDARHAQRGLRRTAVVGRVPADRRLQPHRRRGRAQPRRSDPGIPIRVAMGAGDS